MERNYIAFISYRHLPLEMATAKKLHKRIEHFLIPKELRKDGRKKPGLVFRDQDELPISSNLSENIEQALDHSEYLIVICTPETAKSRWVLREISYFLEHHDRDHVLALLADGTPETAFPAPLTEVRSPEGDIVRFVEPMAANIVADSPLKRERLFRTESLRILAALIGCPYDALYRREQRFKLRRATAAAVGVALVAAAFIGMLLNRNAMIREELRQSLINESKTLAALSQEAYREGDYNGALRYALQALPGEGNERPYVPEAELALSQELDLYRKGVLRYRRSVEQEAPIRRIALSENGYLLATTDEFGSLYCWDLSENRLLWKNSVGVAADLRFLETHGALLVYGSGGLTSFDLQSGKINWQLEDGAVDYLLSSLSDSLVQNNQLNAYFLSLYGFLCVSDDESACLLRSLPTSVGDECFTLVDLDSGEALHRGVFSGQERRLCPAAVLSPDASLAALLLQRSDDSDVADLYLWPTSSEKLIPLAEGLPFSPGSTAYRLLFTDDGSLLLACDDNSGASSLRLYDGSSTPRFEVSLPKEPILLRQGSSVSSLAGFELFDAAGTRAVIGCKRDLYMVDLEAGTLLWQLELSDSLVAGRLYSNACMCLALKNGTVSFCTDEGLLTDTMGIYNFRCGYALAAAAISGPSFDESGILLVPEIFPQRASLVRQMENVKFELKSRVSAYSSRVFMLPSPSRALTLCLGYNPVDEPVEALLLGAQGDPIASAAPPEDCGWEDPGLLYLTEEGLLISPKGVYDVPNETFTPAEEGASLVSAVSARSGSVFSAAVTRGGEQRLLLFGDGALDQTISCPEGSWTIEAVGGCGCVLLREKAGSLTLYGPEGRFSALKGEDGSLFALGADKPMLAAWDGETLRIKDLKADRTVKGPSLPATTVRLLFADHDRMLLAFTGSGELCFIDSASGELLNRSSLAAMGVQFRGRFASYSLASAAGEDRLLIFYNDLYRSEAFCVVYDRASRGVAGFNEGVGAYLPGRPSLGSLERFAEGLPLPHADGVLVCPAMEQIYRSPYYSRKETYIVAALLIGE
ncbi:MAG: TIR domain-containing protein [Oscillospiraceae bacterium]|nr:TIR domain-containing protein [Oscillospiraceae bacterium]